MEEAEDVVIIPIKDRSKETLSAYRTNNRTTVIDITKYKETESFVCEFCSVTLKSLNKLEKHKEQMHGHGKDTTELEITNKKNIKVLEAARQI